MVCFCRSSLGTALMLCIVHSHRIWLSAVILGRSRIAECDVRLLEECPYSIGWHCLRATSIAFNSDSNPLGRCIRCDGSRQVARRLIIARTVGKGDVTAKEWISECITSCPPLMWIACEERSGKADDTGELSTGRRGNRSRGIAPVHPLVSSVM